MENAFKGCAEPLQELYNPNYSGVIVLSDALPAITVAGVLSELQANNLNYVSRPEHYGTTKQGLSSWDFERGVMENYHHLKTLDEYYSLLSKEVHQFLDISNCFDEVRVNSSFYPVGSPGIGPHRDNSFSVNFTAIYVVSGSNEFYSAQDKSCNGEREFKVNPGDLVLLRAPRYERDPLLRPIHYVKEIKSDRYIIVFREINFTLLKQTNPKHLYNT